jgi:hypothetical protein
MAHIKAMQIKHWGIILDGRFDEAYVTSATTIGEVHNRIGLEPRWYIGGYSALVSGLIQSIAECRKATLGNLSSSFYRSKFRSHLGQRLRRVIDAPGQKHLHKTRFRVICIVHRFDPLNSARLARNVGAGLRTRMTLTNETF